MSSIVNVDDTSNLLLYNPASAWIVDQSPAQANVGNGSAHTTTATNSSVTFRFKGTALQVNIFLTPNAANYTAELDEDRVTRPHNSTTLSQTRIWPDVSWSGLEDREHILVITKSANHPDWRSTIDGQDSHLSLDSFDLRGTPLDPPPTDTTTPSPSSPASSDSTSAPRNTPTGAIVGGVFGGLAFLVIIGLLLWFRRRRRMVFIRHDPYIDPNVSPSDYKSTNTLHASSTSTLNLVPLSQSQTALAPMRKERREKQSTSNLPRDSSSNTNRHNTLLELPGHRFIRVSSTSNNPSSDTTLNTSPSTPITTTNTAGSGSGVVHPSLSAPPTTLFSSLTDTETDSSLQYPPTPVSAGRHPAFPFSPLPHPTRPTNASTTKRPLPRISPIILDISPNNISEKSAMALSHPVTTSPNRTDGDGGEMGSPNTLVSSSPQHPSDSPSQPRTPRLLLVGAERPDQSGRRQPRAPPVNAAATTSLLNEVAILRAQVRNLEEMRRQYEGDEEGVDEPPPEYDDDEEESEIESSVNINTNNGVNR